MACSSHTDGTVDIHGGHWASGVPRLKNSLKSTWDPAKADPSSLAGVQLLLLKADISRLKVVTFPLCFP